MPDSEDSEYYTYSPTVEDDDWMCQQFGDNVSMNEIGFHQAPAGETGAKDGFTVKDPTADLAPSAADDCLFAGSNEARVAISSGVNITPTWDAEAVLVEG